MVLLSWYDDLFFVVLVRLFVIRCLVTVFTYVSVIQTAKHIQSNNDNKSNHDHQYFVKLKS